MTAVTLAVLSTGERWRGRLGLQFEKRKLAPARSSAIVQQMVKDNKLRHKNALRATVDERLVMLAWNENPYIVAQQNNRKDPRNHPVLIKDVRSILPIVRKALGKLGLGHVDEQIAKYFQFCWLGQHIRDGQSFGFKSLGGFLEKLLACRAGNTLPWWDEGKAESAVQEDLLTRRLADSFEQTFCSESGLVAQLDEKGWQCFNRAAAKIRRLIDRQVRRNIVLTETDMISNLLECVAELYDLKGLPVYPGHLSSDSTWTILLQMLSEKGVI